MVFKFNTEGQLKSVLDPGFRPAGLAMDLFESKVKESTDYERITIGIKRNNGQISIFETVVFNEQHEDFNENKVFLERYIKTLLWVVGGYQVLFQGPQILGDYINTVYQKDGLRGFDVDFMSKIYDEPFEVIVVDQDVILESKDDVKPVGRHLNGCRIGFDAGGSDRKVSAVIDGKTVFSEEVVWHPKTQADPMYHYEGIKDSLMRAKSKMPRVDAIGVSSAGVYMDNQAMIASLFRKVPEDLFDKHIKNIYIDVAKEVGDVPLVVANDGDVTALAGAMSLDENAVLGIAMGTSQAAGYVDQEGHITGWLNELCFVPVDFNYQAEVDEWSNDYGVGVSYFSQDAVIKLARQTDIQFSEDLPPAEKLKIVQKYASEGHEGALEIFKTVGLYLGYGLGLYQRFYDMNHVLVLGRVTSGVGGDLIVKWAKKVLETEYPKLYQKINIQLPDEKSRRVGQSIAAASLPKI